MTAQTEDKRSLISNKKEPTGDDRGLIGLTSRFYGDNLLDIRFSVNATVTFITRKGSRSHQTDFRFLERNHKYLEDGAKYYVEVIARCFRESDRPSAFYAHINVWLDLVAIRLWGAREYT